MPTLFKNLAAVPPYLKGMWRELGPIAVSREFHAASDALDDFVRAEALSGGWRLRDQERMLAEQKISTNDTPVLAGVVGIFVRALPRPAAVCAADAVRLPGRAERPRLAQASRLRRCPG